MGLLRCRSFWNLWIGRWPKERTALGNSLASQMHMLTHWSPTTRLRVITVVLNTSGLWRITGPTRPLVQECACGLSPRLQKLRWIPRRRSSFPPWRILQVTARKKLRKEGVDPSQPGVDLGGNGDCGWRRIAYGLACANTKCWKCSASDEANFVSRIKEVGALLRTQTVHDLIKTSDWQDMRLWRGFMSLPTGLLTTLGPRDGMVGK